jgi:predicted HicB family RNase H-like nuclease
MALVQVGFMTMRGPDGSFLPEKVPIYREVPVNERGMTKQQEKNTEEIAKDLAGKFKDYLEGLRKEGMKP